MDGIIKDSVPNKISIADIYNFVKSTEKICVVKNKMYIQDSDGIWKLTSDREAILKIRSMFCDKRWQPYLSYTMVLSIINNLKTDPDVQREKDIFIHEFFVRLNDGIWDIRRECIMQPPEKMEFCRIVHADVATSDRQEAKEFTNFCKRIFNEEYFEEKMEALYEIIGFCISDIEKVKKAIFLIGPANCGKSVILRFIQRLIGEENVSNVPLNNFSQRFSIAEMYGKAVNISGEVPTGTLPGRALDVFKSITGNDRIELERKGGQPFSAVINTKLVFAGNTLPIFGKIDGTNSLTERLHILCFDKAVKEEEQDLLLEEKLWNERQYIVRQALIKVNEFIKRNRTFMKLDDEMQLLKSLSNSNNPIAYYIETCLERDGEGFVHICTAYDLYCKLAVDNGLPDISRREFRNIMSTQSGISICDTKKRLNGKNPKTCFKGIKEKITM